MGARSKFQTMTNPTPPTPPRTTEQPGAVKAACSDAAKMNAKINKAFARLQKFRCRIEPGCEEATVTHKYVDALNALIREIINSTVTPSWKGRRPIGWLVRSPALHENQLPLLVPAITEQTSEDERADALSLLAVNIQMDCDTIQRFSRKRRRAASVTVTGSAQEAGK